LGSNPVACARCRGEVALEKLRLTAAEAWAIATWRNVYSALVHLELDSRDYEAWATRELSSPKSAVNRRGLDLRRDLGRKRLVYLYWFFWNEDDPPGEMQGCPLCGRRFRPLGRFIVCARCRIARG